MYPIIIAEAGVNHNGDLEIAKRLIEAAAKAECDYVKFQTFKTQNVVTKYAKKAAYQEVNTGKSETQYEMLLKIEMSYENHYKLIEHCKACNIKFLSTAFDLESVAFLDTLNMDMWKIPSGEIVNLPYLRKIASFKKKIILSTGMSTMAEIENALNILVENGAEKDNIIVLHCNTDYPTNYVDVNLNAMNSIRDTLHVKVGYSDHTLGIEVPIAAIAMGAVVIEKHFTLDTSMVGPDHKASLTPKELKEMVVSIRNIYNALGTGVKVPSESELKNKDIARRSIHILQALPKNHIITEKDLIMKRPGNGISPMLVDSIIGKTLQRDVPTDHILSIDDFV
jgi:N,N'-diacetyllegionaminate synthase